MVKSVSSKGNRREKGTTEFMDTIDYIINKYRNFLRRVGGL